MIGSCKENKKTGTWRGRIDLPPTTDGRRRQVRVHGRTEREVHQKLRKIVNDFEAGIRDPRESRRYTVDMAIDAWLSQSRGLAFRTYESYQAESRRHLRPPFGKIRVADLTPGTIQEAVASWQTDGRSARSITYYLTLLWMVLDRARRDKYRPDNPVDDVRRPALVKPKKPSASPELVAGVLGALAGSRLFTPYFLQVSQGIRPGELLAIRRHDIDLELGTVQINGALEYRNRHLERKRPKTDASTRTLHPPQAILALLAEALAAQQSALTELGIPVESDTALFDNGEGGWWHPDSFRRAYTRLLDRAGVARVQWRGARHTFATLARQLKVDNDTVRSILGHEDYSTTDRFYVERAEDPAAARAASEAVVSLILPHLRGPLIASPSA
jgi:integrase